MRPELEVIERIEQYLRGELSPADKATFETQLAADPALREQMSLQQDVMRGVERAELKQKIATAKGHYITGKNFMRWGLGGLGAIVILVAAFLFYKSQQYHNVYNEYSLPEYNEKGEMLWSDADKNIPAQTFNIDASKDTVIETKGGIVMAIPANGFLDENGNPVTGKIEIAVKEALDPSTMMNAGLSTKSGNDLLESGGMFFIDARKNGKAIKIDPAKGITTEVPAKDIKPGMQLFSGNRKPDGSIDWVDPKPLEHDLMAVDIKSLNFYPPRYLDSLQQWGYDIKNKIFTDSLYYSFASLFSEPSPAYPAVTNTIKPDSLRKADTVPSDFTSLDGRTLFMTKCTSCHKVFQDVTGPALGGVLNNEYYKGDIKKMTRWMNNSLAMVNRDPHYIELKNVYGSVMTQFNMSEQAVKSIFDYIDNVYYRGYDYSSNRICYGINPAKIKTIWSDNFQNTILATREFEERLNWIHMLKDPDLLDLYVNNLDKSLSYIDSMANLICNSGDVTNPFPAFAARRDGKVKNGFKQFELLQGYYANKTKAFTEAITKTQNEYWSKQAELDNDAVTKTNQHQNDSTNRVEENFWQEFDLNLKDAYRQLGYRYDTVSRWPVANTVYQVNVTTTGWNNVDKYVYESTVNRTTLNYTDPETGEKAVIKYNPFSVQVNQWNEYDRLYVYLLPNKLNSFMRIAGADGKFSEKLDELMKYDLVCIGYKDEQPWFYSQKNIQPTNYPGIVLSMINKDELDQKLNRIGSDTQTADMKKENEFFHFEIIDLKRQKVNTTLRELTEKVKEIVFPCFPLERPLTVSYTPPNK